MNKNTRIVCALQETANKFHLLYKCQSIDSGRFKCRVEEDSEVTSRFNRKECFDGIVTSAMNPDGSCVRNLLSLA